MFEKQGFVLVKNVINQETIDFITQYSLFDEIRNFETDGGQVPNAHAKYSDPAMETLLLKMKPIIEKEVKKDLHPTYSFYRIYRNGDILHPHTDRESCEISATLCINYSYDDNEYSWPIIIDGKKINMRPGDLAIYKGIELEHSREMMVRPEEDWHIQCFLHYVDKNGKFSEWKNDKRMSLGQKIRTKRYIERVV